MQAGFWIRFGALLLDAIIVSVPIAFVSYALFGESGGKAAANAVNFLYALLLPVVWGGRTVGKRLCGIRIQRRDGAAPGIGTMLLRQVVGGLIYALTLGVGLIVSVFMIALREDKRAIHDFIADTEVVGD